MSSSPHRNVTLRWLVWLRWFAVVAQALLIVAVQFVAPVDVPIVPLMGILGVVALSNLGLSAAVRRGTPRLGWATAALAFDVVALTVGLDLSGGPMNPFAFLYVVQVSLAAVALRGWSTGLIAILSIAGYGALYFRGHDSHAHHRPEFMELHLNGMWVAMAVTAVIIGYFIAVLQKQLEDKEAEVSEMRASRARHEKLDTLTSLAAGAAHELSTPLGTIAITAKELELELESRDEFELAAEARMIREETRRCQGVLKRLSTSSGDSVGEEVRRVSATTLIEEAIGRAHAKNLVTVEVVEDVELEVPVGAVVESLSALIQNGLDANEDSGASSDIRLRVEGTPEVGRITIEDDGPGIPPEEIGRVSEPFYTTKSKGMGLGLFVASRLMRDLGGSLDLVTRSEGGTTVLVELPRAKA